MQIFNIILGVIAIFGGVYSVFWPKNSFLNAGWIIALILLLWGICAIVTYILDKKRGDKDGYNATTGVFGLVFGIVAVVISVLALFIKPIQAFFLLFILVMFMVFLIVNGINNIIRGTKLKKTQSPKKWYVPVIIGILQLVAAVIGLCNWIFTAGLLQILIGIMLVLFGITLIGSAFAPDPIDRFKEY